MTDVWGILLLPPENGWELSEGVGGYRPPVAWRDGDGAWNEGWDIDIPDFPPYQALIIGWNHRPEGFGIQYYKSTVLTDEDLIESRQGYLFGLVCDYLWGTDLLKGHWFPKGTIILLNADRKETGRIGSLIELGERLA